MKAGDLTEKLFELAWKGHVTNDSVMSLRTGIRNQYKFSEDTPDFDNLYSNRRRKGAPWDRYMLIPGNWYPLDYGTGPQDSLEEEEIIKDRIRIVLSRYGILFRVLLANELPPFTCGI